MQILVLLGMYFDAVVVFVTSQTLFFRLALAILCKVSIRFDVFGPHPKSSLEFLGLGVDDQFNTKSNIQTQVL